MLKYSFYDITMCAAVSRVNASHSAVLGSIPAQYKLISLGLTLQYVCSEDIASSVE
jgi:hypothetical protein